MLRMCAVALACLLPSIALAHSVQCTNEPADTWMTVEAFKDHVAKLGHTILVFKKTSGNCYEIYGRNAQGARIEIYFDPVTARVVKELVR